MHLGWCVQDDVVLHETVYYITSHTTPPPNPTSTGPRDLLKYPCIPLVIKWNSPLVQQVQHNTHFEQPHPFNCLSTSPIHTIILLTCSNAILHGHVCNGILFPCDVGMAAVRHVEENTHLSCSAMYNSSGNTQHSPGTCIPLIVVLSNHALTYV